MALMVAPTPAPGPSVWKVKESRLLGPGSGVQLVGQGGGKSCHRRGASVGLRRLTVSRDVRRTLGCPAAGARLTREIKENWCCLSTFTADQDVT